MCAYHTLCPLTVLNSHFCACAFLPLFCVFPCLSYAVTQSLSKAISLAVTDSPARLCVPWTTLCVGLHVFVCVSLTFTFTRLICSRRIKIHTLTSEKPRKEMKSWERLWDGCCELIHLYCMESVYPENKHNRIWNRKVYNYSYKPIQHDQLTYHIHS